ncbi:MAG: beta-ketoacyl-[acyl-carrier-protein] synthase family protein [Mariniblastus sp.]|nr:beta-ketoacyl-[acyl-carrier-protein] synthase family protein [Mariniblastus sp.]
MSMRQIAVTGYGINSALGFGADVNSAALQAGKSGIVSTRDTWTEHKFKSLVAGNISLDGLEEMFDRKQRRFLCESALLAAGSMQHAIEHAGLTKEEVESPDTGVIVGTGAGASITDVFFLCQRLEKRGAAKVGAYHVPLIMGSSLTANLGSIFQIHGHSYTITSACATSAHAIMLGMDTIRSGRQKRVFVGGSEDVNIYSAGSFDGMNALSHGFNDEPQRASRPLDRDRDGFIFSGGAGILVLEDLETAEARGATIHAVIAGAAASCDGDQMVVPSGIGAQRAMEAAIEDAGISKSDIGYVNLHGTSTPVGDAVELKAVTNVFGDKTPPFSSTKSMTGHALGAAGSQEAIFCMLMMRDGFLAPNINLENPDEMVGNLPVVRETQKADFKFALSNSFGFGGTNCSLVIAKEPF